MNTERPDTTPGGDDDLRMALRTLVATTPQTPTYDQMIDIAARNGLQTPEWATDRYALPDAVGAAPRPRRRIGGVIAAWLLAVGIVGGGGFAAYASFVGPDGYGSPTEATRGFLGALEEGNLLKASRALAPFERDSVQAELQPAIDNAKRNGLLADNDVSAAKHIALAEEGLELQERPLSTGFTRVEATGGKLVLTTDTALLGDAMSDQGLDQSTDLVDRLTPRDANGDPTGRPGFVTVRVDGDWYVSLTYTIADAARLNSGRALPDLTAPIAATGADSPEAAASAALDWFLSTGHDLQSLVDVVDPISGAALHRYRPLLGDPTDVESNGASSIASTRRSTSNWTVDGSGPTRRAQLTQVDVDGPEGSQRYTSGDNCGAGSSDCSPIFGGLFDEGVTVVQRDGRWYVDPISGTLAIFPSLLLGRASAAADPAAEGPTMNYGGGTTEAGQAKLNSLVGTTQFPPEAIGDPTTGWSLSFHGGTAPSPQMLTLVGSCLVGKTADETTPVDAGPDFPVGFWDCVGNEFGGWSYSTSSSSPVTAVAGVSAAPTSTP